MFCFGFGGMEGDSEPHGWFSPPFWKLKGPNSPSLECMLAEKEPCAEQSWASGEKVFVWKYKKTEAGFSRRRMKSMEGREQNSGPKQSGSLSVLGLMSSPGLQGWPQCTGHPPYLGGKWFDLPKEWLLLVKMRSSLTSSPSMMAQLSAAGRSQSLRVAFITSLEYLYSSLWNKGMGRQDTKL